MTSPDVSIPAPTVTERDMLGALQILELASTDPDVVLVLSDEEILALAGADALQILGSPYLDQEQIHDETAASTALRGLIARRMVNPTDQAREEEGDLLVGEGDPSTRLLQLERGLAGVLTLRRIPEGMLVLDRVASEIRTRLGLYFFADGGVLEEFVAVDGFHHFSVPALEGLAARLLAFVDPHEAAGEDGEVEEITVEQIGALDGLEDTRTLTTLTSVGEDGDARATVFALSDRVRVVDNGDADPADLPPDAALAISDVSAQSLQEIIAALLPEPSASPEDASAS